MATIKVESIEPDKEHIGQGVVVKLDVQTSVGRFTFPFAFEDQGSAAENENRALRELRVYLQEALQALEAHEGR
jgi:hypothetical protein